MHDPLVRQNAFGSGQCAGFAAPEFSGAASTAAIPSCAALMQPCQLQLELIED
jgi:hypothetical protein